MPEPDVVGPEPPGTEMEPLFHPCNKLGIDAPRRWLALGWQDFRRAWRQSLIYGVGLMLLGFVTAYIALAVVLPVIGHATWHAYRETVQTDRQALP